MNTYTEQPSERGTWLFVCIAFAVFYVLISPFTFFLSLILAIGSLMAYTLPVGHPRPLEPLPAAWVGSPFVSQQKGA